MKPLVILILKYKTVISVLLITLFGLIPLLHSGLPPTHDGEYHIIRFYEFYKAFSQGDLYPRWAGGLNNGYGLPLFNYVYPLPNYIAAFFHLLGISFIDAFKLNMIVATLLGSLFFYLWSELILQKSGGFVAAVSYAFVPYRFVDIYVRGSVGEVWALAFLPAYLWAITKLSVTKDRKYMYLSGILFALIIFSHNILAVMFTLLIASYNLLLFWKNQWRKTFIISAIISGVIGLSLSAVFWLPAIAEKHYVTGLEIYSVQENFPDLYQLLIPSWGTGFSAGDLQNQMSFQIGIVPLFIVLLSIPVGVILLKRKKNSSQIVIFFLIWFVISIFLMLRVSQPVWARLPLFNYFQFPWRLLSITIVCTSFLSGALVYTFKSRKLRNISAILLLTLTIATTISYTKPAYYHERDDDYYLSRPNFTDGTNSPGNLFNTVWMGKTDKMNRSLIFINGTGSIKTEIEKTGYKKYTVNADSESKLQAKIAYFPGWTVFLDGVKQKPEISENGLLAMTVTEGKHTAEAILLDTIVRLTANIWSLATVVIMLLIAFKHYLRKVII